MTRRSAAAEATRQRIVEATLRLHAEQGILATRAEDIALRADVAVGTVRRYFPTLDALVGACGARVYEIARPPTPELFAAAQSLEERVQLLVRELFASYQRAAPWIEVGRREKSRIPALAAGVAQFDSTVQAVVRATLGPLAGHDRIVRAVVALSDFGVWQSLTNGAHSTQDAAALATEIVVAWLQHGQAAQRTN